MFRSRLRDNELGLLRWLQLFVLACCIPGGFGAGTRGVLEVGDFSPFAYACEISDYGRRLELYRDYRATLMKPPVDPQLCKFPFEVFGNETNVNQTSFPAGFPSNVALLVSLGGCDIYQKTAIAAQLYDSVSSSVRYIVFYNNDADNNDQIVPILPPGAGSDVDVPESIQKLSFLSISTSAGVNIMELIERVSISGRNPIFLGEGNEEWDLPMLVEVYEINGATPTPRNPFTDNNTRVNAGNFYWFRFILFALLIMSPCCRGAYLWYNGGGRIHVRRNENGRIVGLLYISPVSYWFASNGIQDTSTPVTDRLTEEQVLALPEITYKGIQETGAKPKESTEDEKDKASSLDELDIVVSSGSVDENDETDEKTFDTMANTGESVRLDEEEISEGNLSTSCSTCSICIDEFEPGEKLRFLPRCKHAFHTECIMPWLTERQGCCPLCKASVLEESDHDESGNDQANTEAEPTMSHDDASTEQDSLGATGALTNEGQRQYQQQGVISGSESEIANEDSRTRPAGYEGNDGVTGAEAFTEEERYIDCVTIDDALPSTSSDDGDASSTDGEHLSQRKN